MSNKNQTLKLYGLSAEQINEQLKDLDVASVKTYVKEKYRDAFLYVEQKKDEQSFNSALAKIVEHFNTYIYADKDVSLYERLYEILSLRNKSVCLMEQATGGILTSNLLAFEDSEKKVKASYVLPSVKAMIDHFDLNPFKLTANRGLCSEIAFDIACNLRSRIIADIYIVCISTLAEGNELYYNNDSKIGYVAIGTQNGVKLFKLESDANKRDFSNQLAKTICFKLINILK